MGIDNKNDKQKDYEDSIKEIPESDKTSFSSTKFIVLITAVWIMGILTKWCDHNSDSSSRNTYKLIKRKTGIDLNNISINLDELLPKINWLFVEKPIPNDVELLSTISSVLREVFWRKPTIDEIVLSTRIYKIREFYAKEEWFELNSNDLVLPILVVNKDIQKAKKMLSNLKKHNTKLPEEVWNALLILSIQNNDLEMFKLLIEKWINIDSVTVHGETPLMYIVDSNLVQFLEYMDENVDFDANIKSKKGLTALDLIKNNENWSKIRKILLWNSPNS